MSAPHEPAAVARAAAARAVVRVVRDGKYLDTALDEARERRDNRDPSSFSLIQELAYGTLRWYHQLRGIAATFVPRPFKPKDSDVYALLLLGLYQLRHMRIAGYAAVDSTVAAADVLKKRWAKGIINACLRAVLREGDRVAQSIAASDEHRFSHPAWLINAIRNDHSNDWARILGANNERPPMTLRVNALRTTRTGYQNQLQDQGIAAHAHPWVDTALVLETPMPIERLPGFREGLVSVQDAAAQLAAIWLDAQPHERVLDACAAPGGKAAHVLERTPALQALTAIDIDAERLDRVRDNFRRLGLSARLAAADAADPSTWWDGSPYDRILLDAPCSATGVIRRHPDIKVRRQPDEIAKLTQTQARLLDGVWPCLARGGKLLYITCSIMSDENERQLRRFVARHPDALAEPVEPGGNPGGRQLIPGEEGMDGFYYASLRKA